MRLQRVRQLRLRDEAGYLLIVAMLALIVIGIMSGALLVAVARNQQHVSRDRTYTQSLAVAEAGLNQYLWMVAAGTSSEANDFAIPGNTEPDVHKQTITLADTSNAVKGTYTIQVTEPSDDDPRITVKVTGTAASGEDAARTVSAHIGRPSFSQYILLVDDVVYIGGPSNRVWHGKTHSNSGVRIETSNILDTVTCARSTFLGTSHPGVYSDTQPISPLWDYPVQRVEFETVTSDFVQLNAKAVSPHNFSYAADSGPYKGYYIKLLPDKQYRWAYVTAEKETKGYEGSNYGGYLTTTTLSTARNYPDNGVIYVNDDVWIEGTDLDGRITIASSGKLNPAGKDAATSISVVGDITYSDKDGTVAVGLIAQNNLKIPMYAPIGDPGTPGSTLESPGTIDMEIDAAIIAQEGKEYVSYDSSDGNRANWGPRRNQLKFYGSISSFGRPYRMPSVTTGYYAGFAVGVNIYDPFMMYTPPPYFPTIGSFQILDWQELPDSQSIASE